MVTLVLFQNLAALVTLGVVSAILGEKLHRVPIADTVVQGLLFAVTAAVSMLMPFQLEPGITFDGRTVVVSIAALYFGPVAALLSAGTAVAIRVAIGGEGLVMGIMTTASAALIGLAFHRRREALQAVGVPKLLAMGLVVHLVMLVLTVTLPAEAMQDALPLIAPPVVILFPLATILMGKVLDDQIQTRRLQRELSLKESELRRMLANLPGAVYKQAPDPEAPFNYVSRGITDLTGYPPEQFISGAVRIDSTMPAADARIRAGKIREALSRQARSVGRKTHPESTFYLEYGVQPESDRRVFIGEHGGVMRDANGSPESIYGVLIDITARKSAEESATRAQEEREMLLHELFHRSNNTLQIIQSMLRMQMTRADPAAVPYLQRAAGRLQAMAVAQQKVYHSRDLTSIDLLSLCTDLAALVASDRAEAALNLKPITRGDRIHAGLEVALPLASVVYELLTNAALHAFHNRHDGCIEISVRSVRDNGAEIRIRDNGNGLPAGFTLNKRPGFGLGTAFELVNHQLDGELTVGTITDETGTSWTEGRILIGRLR